eukprot:3933161-Rhodomonas_salina.6
MPGILAVISELLVLISELFASYIMIRALTTWIRALETCECDRGSSVTRASVGDAVHVTARARVTVTASEFEANTAGAMGDVPPTPHTWNPMQANAFLRTSTRIMVCACYALSGTPICCARTSVLGAV